MFRVVVASLLLAVPVLAQDAPSAPPPPARTFDFWVRGNVQAFDNFYQASDGQPEETVTAFGAEVGASMPLMRGLSLFGQTSWLQFNDSALEGSPAFRIGVRGDTRPHAYEIYAEHLSNRPSFELDEFVGADVTRVAGEYSYRFLEDWQASVDAELDQQELGGATGRDNSYVGVGGAIRWRGSRTFSPELGFRTGAREVDDDAQSYDQSERYLQIRSQATDKLYLSVRFRDRKREYQNVSREDKRRQISASADYSLTPSWVLNLYGSRESNDTNQVGRDASWAFWLAGVTYRF